MNNSTTPLLLEGKVAIVTGSGRGVGRCIALELARCGASVVINDIGSSITGEGNDISAAQSVVDEITAFGGHAVASGHSVADWTEAQALIATARNTFGRLDIVVNNAGNLRDGIFHKMSPEEFNSVIDVHLRGSFYVSRAAAPFFKEQGSGSFIHMTSSSGLIGNFGQANYCAAKLGIVGLSKAIALDMSRFIDSLPNETEAEKKRNEGLKKLVPEKIAPLIAALGSDASQKVTGQIFGVRNNEIYLFSQPRVLRTAHTSDGWTPDAIIERVFPMFENDFYPLDRSGDVFTWEPV